MPVYNVKLSMPAHERPEELASLLLSTLQTEYRWRTGWRDIQVSVTQEYEPMFTRNGSSIGDCISHNHDEDDWDEYIDPVDPVVAIMTAENVDEDEAILRLIERS